MSEKPNKSVLLLGCKEENGNQTHTWFKISPIGGLLVQNRISTEFSEQLVYSHTQAVVIGSYLYLIGGFSRTERIMSNTIVRSNLNNPGRTTWEECFKLPFYCHSHRLAVCGKLIYIFKGHENFSLDSKELSRLKMEDWAYVYDSVNSDGWFITPPSSLPFKGSRMVTFCGTVNWNGEEKVVVYLGLNFYIHYPISKAWRPYSEFNRLCADPIFRRYEFDVIADVVQNGIFYYMHYDWRFFDDETGSKQEVKPTLTAYDIRKGNHLFQLEVDSVGLGRAGSSFSHLVAIGESEFSWINTLVVGKGFSVTKIGIRYDPKPKLVILKEEKFDEGISGFACCLPIDLPSEEKSSSIKEINTSCDRCHTRPETLEYTESGNTMSKKPEKSVLLLGCTEGKGELINTWFKLSPTGDLSVENRISSKLWELGYSHTHGAIVGSYLYIIGGLSCEKSEPQRTMSNMIIRTNLANPGISVWEECFKLSFYCHTDSVAVCGDLIYIFEGNTSFSLDSKQPSNLSIEEWGYVYDTVNRDGWFIDPPPSADGNDRLSVPFCAAVDWCGLKVGVYVGEQIHIHDNYRKTWRPYSNFNSLYADPVFRRDESVIARVVNNGILYYMHYDWRFFDDESQSKEEVKPTLTAYDIKEGIHLFQLEVDSVGLGLADGSFSHLVAIGDLELCWINTQSADQGFFVTKIGIRYDPKPKLVILERKRFHASGISSFACCLPFDLPSEETT